MYGGTSKPEVYYSDEEDEDDEENKAKAAARAAAESGLTRRQRRAAAVSFWLIDAVNCRADDQKLTVSELKQLVDRPEVVEWFDCDARDPRLLVSLKSYRK